MPTIADAVRPRRTGAILANWLLAYVFALFAYAHARMFVEHPRLSLALIVAVEALLVVFILTRKDADQTRHSWKTWLSTVAGTFCPLLLRPVEAPADMLAGQMLQLAGAGLQIAALASLNRSMGLLPAHRGVKSRGLYCFVRHPLYVAYAITLTGYLISNLSVYNATVISIGMAFQLWRIHNEEKLLLQYPDYVTFAAKTRWRMIPYVW